MDYQKRKFLEGKSKEIRQKVIDFHKKLKWHHAGCSLSCVEILSSLYYEVMQPNDYFLLSKGHAASVFYIILNDLGKIQDEQIYHLEEHPTLNEECGIFATTGSLGQGLSIGVGFAIAEPNRHTFILMGDGECDEGQVWEAVKLASELKLGNLTAIVDCNGWQGFKKTDYEKLGDIFSAFGWGTTWCDGHDVEELVDRLSRKVIGFNKPFAIFAKTVKGKGVPEIENKLESHYAVLQ